jgi:hypothetical protein
MVAFHNRFPKKIEDENPEPIYCSVCSVPVDNNDPVCEGCCEAMCRGCRDRHEVACIKENGVFGSGMTREENDAYMEKMFQPLKGPPATDEEMSIISKAMEAADAIASRCCCGGADDEKISDIGNLAMGVSVTLAEFFELLIDEPTDAELAEMYPPQHPDDPTVPF